MAYGSRLEHEPQNVVYDLHLFKGVGYLQLCARQVQYYRHWLLSKSLSERLLLQLYT